MLIRFEARPPAAFIGDAGQQVSALRQKPAAFPVDAHDGLPSASLRHA